MRRLCSWRGQIGEVSASPGILTPLGATPTRHPRLTIWYWRGQSVDPAEIWRLLRTEGITHLSAAPTVLTMIAEDDAAGPLDHEVHVDTGGAPPVSTSATLLARLDKLRLAVTHLYGLSETYGPLAINEWQPEWDDLEPDRQAMLQPPLGRRECRRRHAAWLEHRQHRQPARPGEVLLAAGGLRGQQGGPDRADPGPEPAVVRAPRNPGQRDGARVLPRRDDGTAPAGQHRGPAVTR